MSAPEEQGVSDAMAIEMCAADWVADRRNTAEWTAERQAELDAWLARSVAHRVAFLRIDATWQRTDRLAALRQPMREAEPRSTPNKQLWSRIAAAIGLVAVIGVVGQSYFTRPEGQVIETPKGGQERLGLADGSQIVLNTDSAVRVNLGARARSVELLRGEAYFQVRHDAQRPFVVTVGGHRIVDLGTKFLVRMAPKSLQVALLEGSARLENANASAKKDAVILTPGDVAVATAGATHVTRKTDREISERLAWQRGAVVFHNARLADAVAEFNRYGGPQLVIADPQAEKLTINGTFLTTGAEDFAAITHEIFGLKTEHKDGHIVLSR
jgi:transmembrane sensor